MNYETQSVRKQRSSIRPLTLTTPSQFKVCGPCSWYQTSTKFDRTHPLSPSTPQVNFRFEPGSVFCYEWRTYVTCVHAFIHYIMSTGQHKPQQLKRANRDNRAQRDLRAGRPGVAASRNLHNTTNNWGVLVCAACKHHIFAHHHHLTGTAVQQQPQQRSGYTLLHVFHVYHVIDYCIIALHTLQSVHTFAYVCMSYKSHHDHV